MRISDWSSDVCSSDLPAFGIHVDGLVAAQPFQHLAVAGDGGGQAVELLDDAWHVGRGDHARIQPQQRGFQFVVEVQAALAAALRSEEHTSELQSLMRISYAVFCLKKKKTTITTTVHCTNHRKDIRQHI